MKNKRWLVLFIAGILTVTGGCSSKIPETGKENTTSELTEVTQAELFCDVDWWHPPAWTTQEGTITGDITASTGVALETIVPQQDADKQLSLMLLEDNLPDLLTVTDPTVIGQLTSSGKVWKLDEFLEEYCPESHLLTEFPEDMKRALVCRDGAWYVLPSHVNTADAREIWKPCDIYYSDQANYSDNNGIMWNRSLLEQLGLSATELSTEDQVKAAWKKAKESGITVNGQKIVPLLIDGSSYWDSTFKYLQYSFGAEYIDEDGNYKDILLQPESRHALRFLNRAYYSRCFEVEQINYTNDEVKAKIAGGNVLCFIGNLSNTGMDATEWVSSGAILSSTGETPVLGKNLQGNTGWLQTFVSKDCKDPDKIAGFLDYITSEEGMLKWNFGYEGKDYSVGDDGLIYLTEEQNKQKDDYSTNGIDAWWMFTNTAWARSVMGLSDKDSEEMQEGEIKNAFGKDSHTVIYDTSAFGSHTDLVQNEELKDVDTRIASLKKEWISKVILSGSDTEFLAAYERMTDALTDAGIERVDREKNRTFQEKKKEMGISLEKINK